MLFIIEIIAGLFLLGVVAVAVFIMMQPKHRFVFDVKTAPKRNLRIKPIINFASALMCRLPTKAATKGLCLTLLCVFTCRRSSMTKRWCAVKLI